MLFLVPLSSSLLRLYSPLLLLKDLRHLFFSLVPSLSQKASCMPRKIPQPALSLIQNLTRVKSNNLIMKEARSPNAYRVRTSKRRRRKEIPNLSYLKTSSVGGSYIHVYGSKKIECKRH